MAYPQYRRTRTCPQTRLGAEIEGSYTRGYRTQISVLGLILVTYCVQHHVYISYPEWQALSIVYRGLVKLALGQGELFFAPTSR